jgi:hypothetical protein
MPAIAAAGPAGAVLVAHGELAPAFLLASALAALGALTTRGIPDLARAAA